MPEKLIKFLLCVSASVLCSSVISRFRLAIVLNPLLIRRPKRYKKMIALLNSRFIRLRMMTNILSSSSKSYHLGTRIFIRYPHRKPTPGALNNLVQTPKPGVSSVKSSASASSSGSSAPSTMSSTTTTSSNNDTSSGTKASWASNTLNRMTKPSPYPGLKVPPATPNPFINNPVVNNPPPIPNLAPVSQSQALQVVPPFPLSICPPSPNSSLVGFGKVLPIQVQYGDPYYCNVTDCQGKVRPGFVMATNPFGLNEKIVLLVSALSSSSTYINKHGQLVINFLVSPQKKINGTPGIQYMCPGENYDHSDVSLRNLAAYESTDVASLSYKQAKTFRDIFNQNLRIPKFLKEFLLLYGIIDPAAAPDPTKKIT